MGLSTKPFICAHPTRPLLFKRPKIKCSCNHELRPVRHEEGCDSNRPLPIAHILFVGEAPGEVEDITGKPFMGPAGHQLNCFFYLTKSTYFFTITNTIGCRPVDPKGNRQPTGEEKDACRDHIYELLAHQQFDGVVLLGETAAKHWETLKLNYQTLELSHPAKYLRMNYRYLPQKIEARKFERWLTNLHLSTQLCEYH